MFMFTSAWFSFTGRKYISTRHVTLLVVTGQSRLTKFHLGYVDHYGLIAKTSHTLKVLSWVQSLDPPHGLTLQINFSVFQNLRHYTGCQQ